MGLPCISVMQAGITAKELHTTPLTDAGMGTQVPYRVGLGGASCQPILLIALPPASACWEPAFHCSLHLHRCQHPQ